MHGNDIIEILKALADTTRLDIVRQLVKAKDCTSCSQVREASTLSQPAMSHHLNKLVEAGVVIETRRGKEKDYELNNELLQVHGIDAARL